VRIANITVHFRDSRPSLNGWIETINELPDKHGAPFRMWASQEKRVWIVIPVDFIAYVEMEWRDA